MTSRIKNISELPKWFHLDKYKAAKKLNAAGWYEQFAIRGKLMEWFNTEVESKFQDMLKTELAEALTLIRETPIFDIQGAGRGKLSSILFFYDAEYICKNHNNIPAVYPMSLEEFDYVRRGIDPKRIEYVARWADQFEADPINLFHVYKHESWIKRPLNHSATEEAKDENGFGFRGMDSVIVDLNFPIKS